MKCCVGDLHSDDGRPLGYKYAEVTKIFNSQYFLIDTQDSLEIAGPVVDENFEDKHELGSVGMSLDSSSTQFYVTLGRCEWLDGLMHVIGRLCEGKEKEKILRIMESSATLPGGRPKFDARVSQCGQL